MNAEEATPARWRLVEIWGDTADLGHLAWSIAIGVAVSLTGYLVASRVLASTVGTPELARAYAMLAGLGGCVVSGLICAKLFTPKREVVEGTDADPRWREEVLAELAAEHGGLGSMDDLPPVVVREMKELEIHELFASYEPRARRVEGAAQ
ncbi:MULTISPECIES: hypothetical protein [unclassified Variovorax]|jgi:hypothetical protein|uniref:hypothetical protein n=1 Tax=unclassified Variovorax TaxID=663243 RepID=UPI000F7E6BC5|nr:MULTISPECIES: hypothetical protein [unclassified Variovorax]RSZ38125.1 hypothetical protein EJO70_18445 [Variovorax sp. 553]RSZ39423.1 hypothetical protein EJO71_20805 [Variovorax sp. 679]